MLRFLTRSVSLWVGLIFVVAGAGAVVAGVEEWRNELRFEREAVSTHATVVAKSFQAADREDNPRTRYVVTYRFTAADGRAIEQTGEVPVDDWERLDSGSVLDVRYMPGDPSTARTHESLDWIGSLALTAMAALFVVIGVALAQSALRRALVVFRLHRRGVPAHATVLDVWATRTTINRVRQWQLSYEFRDEHGHTQRGKSDLLSPHEASGWQRGAQGAIRYDRERPHESVWLGKIEGGNSR